MSHSRTSRTGHNMSQEPCLVYKFRTVTLIEIFTYLNTLFKLKMYMGLK